MSHQTLFSMKNWSENQSIFPIEKQIILIDDSQKSIRFKIRSLMIIFNIISLFIFSIFDHANFIYKTAFTYSIISWAYLFFCSLLEEKKEKNISNNVGYGLALSYFHNFLINSFSKINPNDSEFELILDDSKKIYKCTSNLKIFILIPRFMNEDNIKQFINESKKDGFINEGKQILNINNFRAFNIFVMKQKTEAINCIIDFPTIISSIFIKNNNEKIREIAKANNLSKNSLIEKKFNSLIRKELVCFVNELTNLIKNDEKLNNLVKIISLDRFETSLKSEIFKNIELMSDK